VTVSTRDDDRRSTVDFFRCGLLSGHQLPEPAVGEADIHALFASTNLKLFWPLVAAKPTSGSTKSFATRNYSASTPIAIIFYK
jgi:hypothetical protein